MKPKEAVPPAGIVLFQSDIRRALAHLGRAPFFRYLAKAESAEESIEELAVAASMLSAQRVGVEIGHLETGDEAGEVMSMRADVPDHRGLPRDAGIGSPGSLLVPARLQQRGGPGDNIGGGAGGIAGQAAAFVMRSEGRCRRVG